MGLKHSCTQGSPQWRRRGRERVSSQRGEEAGIWVSGVRNENGRRSPSALLTGECNEMGHLRRTVKMRNQNWFNTRF